MNWATFKAAYPDIPKEVLRPKSKAPDLAAEAERLGTESAHQKALFQWSAFTENRERWPELVWLFSVPNGGYRPKPIAAAMKAEGARSGVPDICLPIKRGIWPCLWIELKRPATPGKRVGKTSEDQDGYIAHMRSQGYAVAVAIGWHQARETLIAYLEMPK